jgi:hypothetical protein
MSTLLVNNIKAFSGDTVAISGSNISISGNTALGDGLGTDITTVKGKLIFSSSLTRIILSSSGEIKLTSPSDGHTGVTHGFSLTNQDQDFKGSITASAGIKTGGNSSLGNGAGDTHTITGESTFSGTITAPAITAGTITASGDISASGTIFADGFQSATGGTAIDFNDGLDVNGNSAFTGSVGVSGSINVVNGSISALNGLISGSGVAALGTVSGPTGSFGLIKSLNNGLGLRILGDTILGNALSDTHKITGHITASGNISSSGTVIASDIQTFKHGELGDKQLVSGSTQIKSLLSNQALTVATLKSNGAITASGIISASGNLIVGGTITGLSSITAPEISGSVGVNSPTGSFGVINNSVGTDLRIKASDDIILDPSDNIEIRANGVLKSTFFGTEGKLRVGSTNSTAPSNVLHVGGTSGGSVFCGPLTSSAIILTGSVRNISNANLVTANGFDTNKGTANSQDLNTSAVYNVQGRKVEVKAITAAQINDGAFAQFKLANNSIAIDSIVLGSFTGGTGGPITGSILTAATITAGTASVQIHNETGGAIAADAPFTASFIVL